MFAQSSSTPQWLEDAGRAAQHLTRLSLEVDARAALIIRRGELWAYTGQLPQPAAQELVEILLHDQPRSNGSLRGESDLARFVHLQSVDGDFMLYATALGEDMFLGLAFEAETPFSKMRTQAMNLARALSSPPQADRDESQPVLEEEDLDWEDDFDLPVEPLLPPDLVPPPTPPRLRPEDKPLEDAWAPAQPAESAAQPGPADATEMRDTDQLGGPSTIPSFLAADTEEGALEDRVVEERPLEKAIQVRFTELVPDAETLDLRPASTTLYSLNYACVLIPRLPQHHLTGPLTARLAECVQQLSMAFAWRLEYLSIRPDYLLWVSSVPPDTSPGYLVKMMRRHTSQRIFYEFPNLEKENPSGDFWAPGYLVIATSQPPPAQALRDFVEQTRQQQNPSPW